MDIPTWNEFSAFGGMLIGPEVYDSWTTDNLSFLTPALVRKGNYRRINARSQVLAFLKEVNDHPTMYGITGTNHVEGVHCLFICGQVSSPELANQGRLEPANFALSCL